MNNCVFTGNVCGTPMINEKDGATKVARYRLAVDTGYTDKEGNRRQAFLNCVAFGKGADFVQQHLDSGDRISVIASAMTSDYTDDKGVKHYVTEFVVSSHEFAETKAEKERRRAAKASQNGNPAVPAAQPVVQPQPMMQPQQPIPVGQVSQPVYQQPVAQPQPMAPVAPVAPAVPVMPVAQPVPTAPMAPAAPAAPVAPVAPIAPASDFSGFNAFTEFPFN